VCPRRKVRCPNCSEKHFACDAHDHARSCIIGHHEETSGILETLSRDLQSQDVTAPSLGKKPQQPDMSSDSDSEDSLSGSYSGSYSSSFSGSDSYDSDRSEKQYRRRKSDSYSGSETFSGSGSFTSSDSDSDSGTDEGTPIARGKQGVMEPARLLSKSSAPTHVGGATTSLAFFQLPLSINSS